MIKIDKDMNSLYHMNKDQFLIISPKVRPRRPQMKLVDNMFKNDMRKMVLQQH